MKLKHYLFNVYLIGTYVVTFVMVKIHLKYRETFQLQWSLIQVQMYFTGYIPRIFTEYILSLAMGFSRKLCTPPMSRKKIISLDFQLILSWTPGQNQNHIFSSNFGMPPWNSNYFYSTPRGIFHWCLQQEEGGVEDFFSGKAQSRPDRDVKKVIRWKYWLTQ